MKIHAIRPLLVSVLALATATGLTALAQSPEPGQAATRTEPASALPSELRSAMRELEQAQQRVAEVAARLHVPAPNVGPNDKIVMRKVIRKPVLGVVLSPDPGGGVRIAAVTPGSAAAKAGLRAADRIVAVDGQAFPATQDDERLKQAQQKLVHLKTDKPVKLDVLRDGHRRSISVQPEIGENVMVFDNTDGSQMMSPGNVVIHRGHDGTPITITFQGPAAGPQISEEIIKLGPDRCQGDQCRLPLLSEAFRWNGLNMASVDKQLGRYFGTDRGVLLLSIPDELGDLQAGDVVTRVDGKSVATPREALDAIHGRPAGTPVKVDYLRDRKAQVAEVILPMRQALPLPPLPPPPPAPAAPAAPPAPPPPPAPPTELALT